MIRPHARPVDLARKGAPFRRIIYRFYLCVHFVHAYIWSSH